MSTLFPEVRDVGSITGIFSLSQFLLVGIEGQMDAVGNGVIGTPYTITEGSVADDLFGPVSSLSGLVKFMLDRGLESVVAVASASGATPLLTERQTAWATLEENEDVRVRLTDSVVQADLVALADSCEWAEGIQNKQFCVVGIATPTTEATLTTAAGAMASKRGVLVGPGVLDEGGVLLSGVYSSAFVAGEVAKNPDIVDDLDTLPLIGTTGIEKAANGMPLFRVRAGAGTPVNDFNTLLAGGVSPLRQGRTGRAEIVHLRTTYTTDDTFDALQTLLIKDQVFIDLRRALLNPAQGTNFLRRGNTPENRSLAAAIVNSELEARNTWVLPKELPDGTVGYGVTVTASPDKKRMIVSYQGEIVRGTQKIDIAGVLTIPV